jgi:hypothetical protein
MRVYRKKKKRSLRGKIFLCIAYMIILLIIIGIFNLISTFISPKDRVDVPVNKSDVDSLSKDNDKINKVDTINTNEKITSSDANTDIPQGDGSKTDVKINYDQEKKLVKDIASLIVTVPYSENGFSYINKDGIIETEGIDSFGLIEFTYLSATGKNLKDVGITKDTINKCIEVSSEELNIGDIGICKLGNATVYGVYVGEYGTNSLFAYACDLSNGLYESGSVYISFNKNECNDLFIGMFPLPYEKFYRLPSMEYDNATGTDITELIPRNIIPSESYNENASAVYRLGEWFRTKDTESLLNRMNVESLEDEGYYLDTSVFKASIDSYDSYIGNDNYIFRILSYTTFKGYTTVHADLVSIGETERTFMDSGLYFDCTIYDDGSYIPGSVFALGKYSRVYGFTQLQGNEKDTLPENDTDSAAKVIGQPAEEERYINGNGFSIDTGNMSNED